MVHVGVICCNYYFLRNINVRGSSMYLTKKMWVMPPAYSMTWKSLNFSIKHIFFRDMLFDVITITMFDILLYWYIVLLEKYEMQHSWKWEINNYWHSWKENCRGWWSADHGMGWVMGAQCEDMQFGWQFVTEGWAAHLTSIASCSLIAPSIH